MIVTQYTSAAANDVRMFMDGSNMYMDLGSGMNNFYIRDGSTIRFIFDDNGDFSAATNINCNNAYLMDNIAVINSDRRLSAGLLSAYATVGSGGGTTVANRTVRYLTSNSQTLTLPASPSAGAEVVVVVGNYTNCSIGRNGQRIMGLSENLTIDKANVGIRLIYINSTYGWRIC